jgi:hypothetical protein
MAVGNGLVVNTTTCLKSRLDMRFCCAVSRLLQLNADWMCCEIHRLSVPRDTTLHAVADLHAYQHAFFMGVFYVRSCCSAQH